MYSILTDHATVTHKSKTITILAHPDAKLMVNGKPERDEKEIHHNDRFFFLFLILFVCWFFYFIVKLQTKVYNLSSIQRNVLSAIPCFFIQSSVQTDDILLTNNSQHCWMLHVMCVCTPCCMFLRVAGSCCANLKTCQTFSHV